MVDTVIAPDLRERWETLLLDAVDNDGEFTDEDAAWSFKMIERVSKAEAENAFLKSQEAWKRIDSMSSTIDRMTLEIAQLAVTAKRVASADEENEALRAKVAKLEAPISDEEWGECDVPALAEFDALHRKLANAITAARGREGE